MPLVKQDKILPKNYSKVAGVLSVYEKDDEDYEPYVSPFNTAGLGQIINVEKPDEDLKKYNLQMSDEIKKTHHLYILSDVDINEDYTSISSTATVTIPYKKESLKYIQRGACCLLKLFRVPRNANVDKINLKDHNNYIKARNKRRNKQKEYEEEMKEVFPVLVNQTKQNPDDQENNENNQNNEEPGEENPSATDFIHRFAPLELSEDEISRRSLEGFITDVKLKPNTIEISIKGWNVLLEGKDIMEFHQMHRSEIVKEVIATAGLHPLVDFTGMPDDIIDWKSSKDKENPLQPAFGDDCTPTDKMAVDSSLNEDTNTGNGNNYDNQSKIGYAKQGTEYYNWARQFSSVESLAKAFRKRWHYMNYWANERCPEEVFKQGRGNCWDTARLFKCCCDSAGFPCVVVRGPGHAWNLIKIGNQWKTWDACYTSRLGNPKSTNAAGF